jgi:hypothetical protein
MPKSEANLNANSYLHIASSRFVVGGVSIPLSLLLTGYIYYTAINYFEFGPDVSAFTIFFYFTIFAWTIFQGQKKRGDANLCIPDILIVTVFCLVCFSFLIHNLTSGLWKYIPFMTIIPYFCGRLLKGEDATPFLVYVAILSLGIAVIGLLYLPLIWKGWLDTAGRTPLFGNRANTVIIGLGAGALGILATAYLLRPSRVRHPLLEVSALVLIPFLIFLQVLLAGKTALISALAISVFMIFLANWSGLRLRLILAVLLIGTVVVSFEVAPSNVGKFYKLQNLSEISRVFRNTLIIPSSIPTSSKGAQPSKGNADPKVLVPAIDVSEDNTMAVRIVLIDQAWDAFRSHPLLGAGPGNIGKPHSTIVQMFTEFGVFAGAAFVLLIVLTLASLTKVILDARSFFRNQAWALIMLYIYYLVNDQTQGAIHSALPFFLLTGVSASIASEANIFPIYLSRLFKVK